MTKVKTKKNSDFWERNRKSNGYLLKKEIMKYGVSICRFFLLFGMCFLILQPILNKISVSFMTQSDLFNPSVINIPEHFTTENYKLTAKILDYKNTLINSILVSLSASIIQIAMATLVGYGFARFKFPFKNFWFACVLLVILVPPQTIATSLHLHFRFFDILGISQALTGTTINLRSSPIPYYMMCFTCMGLKNGLYIYMIRQFFRNIPAELEEAAYVDGCGTLMTFVRIMLPDAKPILTSCFLFSFVWQWTDGFYAGMFLGKIKMLAAGLSTLGDALSAYIQSLTGLKSAVSVAYTNCILATGTLMIIMPLVIIYLFAQKGFVESISSSGIKM